MWYDEADYKSINAGKRMKELDKPEEGLRRFWEPVEGYGLHDLIYTGYSTVTHAMIRAMCERWHTYGDHREVRPLPLTPGSLRGG